MSFLPKIKFSLKIEIEVFNKKYFFEKFLMKLGCKEYSMSHVIETSTGKITNKCKNTRLLRKIVNSEYITKAELIYNPNKSLQLGEGTIKLYFNENINPKRIEGQSKLSYDVIEKCVISEWCSFDHLKETADVWVKQGKMPEYLTFTEKIIEAIVDHLSEEEKICFQ